ncbi:MAG TPA: iron-containing redox enzyme family protein [Thermoanaerobaculia bacterium]|jgi:pyrroloquinoline quinone (PQQ) biosynthesis protein C|nr:iron-containing redox enzyme family protein [Thermoanaerobaculia bacterium]
MLGTGINERLEENPLRKALIHHPFFKEVKTSHLDREQVGTFLGQWWHPLHYFPNFLSRTIDQVPILEMKTAISKILYQELGEGDPARAHERIYVATMTDAGFDRATVSEAEPFEETRRLVQRYREASAERLSALGFVYGTEVADLAMVAGIGNAVRRVSGMQDLPWVDIHILQEPDHVEQVNEAIEPDFTAQEVDRIVASAEEMWSLWIGFFDRLRKVMFGSEELPASEPALVAATS